MLEQRTGKTLTSESDQAAQLYGDALDLILGSESGAAETLDRALALDKNFALAAAARYYVANDVGEPDATGYRDLAQRAALTASDWEREHVEVLVGLIDEPGATREKAEAYLRETPGDLLVMSQLAGTLFFYGGPTKLETVLGIFEAAESVLGDDWAFLARLGFAASEAGQYQRARQLIERALQMRPQALYSIHALAHLLHDEGAAEESATLLRDWLAKHEDTARAGQMFGHVHWHLALDEWQMGERDAAMRRYLEFSAPATTTCGPILTLADCGGFLLREYLKSGQPLPLRDDVLAHIERVWGMIGHPFIALHVAGLYASAGDLAGLERCAKAIADTPAGPNRDTSLKLVSALSDYVSGQFPHSVQTLATLSRGARIGIGGSHVERILVDLLEQSATARA
ncbi:hypothetical protein [Microbulbifer sp. SAOS-129_SWC]|uniref:hypothetical protein n=1 Tax=Microbulbifer sp. SAOS-129_SWC TaxID=3145235 RepID=UPI0032180B10